MTYVATLPTTLTVAQVAAVFGAIIVFLSLSLNFAFAPVLIGLHRRNVDDQHGEVLARRIVETSLWPEVLRFDRSRRSANWSGKTFESILPYFSRNPVNVIYGMLLVATLAFMTAGFTTAWPLREKIAPAGSSIYVDFGRAIDFGYFGQATLDRPAQSMSRVCGALGPAAVTEPCPNVAIDQSREPEFSSAIPNALYDAFRTGEADSAISSPWDIQYRIWRKTNIEKVAEDETMPVGDYRFLETNILRKGFLLIEGLILDMTSGGVGLRNHTAPLNLENGAQWEEDILWITPETSCTDLNLTLHYTLVSDFLVRDGYLQDDGGFSHAVDADAPLKWYISGWKESGPVPDLKERSFMAAWWNNNFTAQVLRVTSPPPKPGSRYVDGLQFYFDARVFPGTLLINPVDGVYLGDLNKAAFSDVGETKCSGYSGVENATTLRPYVKCGYIFTIPYPDDGKSWRNDQGSKWTQRLYTCASSSKASIRTVTFSSNGTTSLDGMKVLDVRDKEYSSSEFPLWGVEKADGYAILDIRRVWGLLGELQASSSRLITRTAPDLYLPATAQTPLYSHLVSSRDLFAAGSVFTWAWNDLYYWAASTPGQSTASVPRYSGTDGYGLALKFRELGQHAEGAATLLNLLWTDMVSAAVVSTRTGFAHGQGSRVLGRRNVNPHIHILEYRQFWFAIPAIVGLFLLLAALAASAILMLRGAVTRETMNDALHPGRAKRTGLANGGGAKYTLRLRGPSPPQLNGAAA